MKFTIDTKKWIYTDKDLLGGSFLVRQADKKMCCLGFYGLACGIPIESLLGEALFHSPPSGRRSTALPSMFWLFNPPSPKMCAQLTKTHRRFVDIASMDNQALLTFLNDCREFHPGGAGLSIADKKKSIAEIFAENGITVDFV